MKRPMTVIGFSLLFGGIAGYFIPTNIIFIFLVISALFIFLSFFIKFPQKSILNAMIIFFILGTCVFHVTYQENIKSAEKYYDQKLSYQVEIETVSKLEKTTLYQGRIKSIEGTPILKNYGITFFSEEKYSVFDIVEITSHLYSENEDSFISKTYNESNNIVFFGNFIRKEEKVGLSHNKFLKSIDYFRNLIYNRIDSIYNEKEAEIIKGAILGDRSGFEKDDYNHIKRTGLAHLFAASGFNLSVFAGFIMVILSFFRISRKIRSIIGIIVILIFTALAGFSPSILRAGFMFLVVLSGNLFNHRSDTLNSLGLSILIIFLINPLMCINISFLLSVFAILGILIIASPLNHYMEENIQIKNPILKNISLLFLELVSTGFGACVATIPVMLVFFNNISLLSPITTILFVYPIEFIFIGGIISIFIPQSINFLSPAIAFVIKEQSKMIEFISNLNIGVISLNPFLKIIFILVCAVIIVLRFIKPKKKTIKKTIILVTCFVVLFISLISVILDINRLTLSFIDVGQGDSILLKYDGQSILFDAGGTKSYQNVLDEINDVKLDYLILSHYHSDHSNYIDNLQERIKVKTIIAPPARTDAEKKQLSDFEKYSDVVIAYNDVTLETEDVIIKVMTRHTYYDYDDKNNTSLISHIKYKDFTALLTGDMEFDGELKFIKEYKERDLDIDVLKVAHHGSASGTSKMLLDYLRPEISVISVGENNQYNHPETSLLERLETCQSEIYRTDKDSSVRIFTYGDKYYVH